MTDANPSPEATVKREQSVAIRFMKAIAIVAGIGCLLIAGLAFYGSRIEETFEVDSKRTIDASVEQVWTRLTEYNRFVEWQNGLKSIELVRQPTPDQYILEETYHDGHTRRYMLEKLSGRKEILLEEKDDSAPLQYSWVIALEPDKGQEQSLVSITGETRVSHPILRLIIDKFIGKEAFSQQYLSMLSKSFEE